MSFKGYIPTILAEENTIDLSKEENKGWLELIRLAASVPNSKCCNYPVHLNSEGVICTYCGEVCEIIEK